MIRSLSSQEGCRKIMEGFSEVGEQPVYPLYQKRWWGIETGEGRMVELQVGR